MNNNTPHKPRKNRHAKRHAAEQTEPFGFDELETRSQEFRNDRRLRGAQQANADCKQIFIISRKIDTT